MRYVAAYLLAALGGNNNVTAKDLEKILSSVGIEAESDKVARVIKELSGKSIPELIEAGSKKLSSVPSGGAPAAGGGGGAPAAAAAGGGDKEAKKEEKKPESEEESDDDMGFGLFD